MARDNVKRSRRAAGLSQLALVSSVWSDDSAVTAALLSGAAGLV